MTVPAAEEGAHRPGDHPWWSEAWTFDCWSTDARTGAYTAVVLLPNFGRAWYWAAVVRSGAPLLTVVDLDQPLPVGTLRLRGGTLWADHVCEAPFEQWTVLNETYGVALDDPDEALGRALGTPEPVAFDLEWYATGPAEVAVPGGLVREGAGGYRQAGEVDGVIELRSGPLELTGPAVRRHWWGVRDWFGAGWGAPVDGVRAPVLLQGPDGQRAALERVLTRAGWEEWCRPLP